MRTCRLCQTVIKGEFFHSETPFKATYLRCATCDLIQMDQTDLLSPQSERSHYLNHKNSIGDPQYEAFLEKLLTPMLKFYSPGDSALDFGCGPVCAMANLFERSTHHSMKSYDPIFGPELDPDSAKFNFITSSETIEHFNRPADSWKKLVGLLEEKGHLGVMSSLVPQDKDFATWTYRYDRTHVAFYSDRCFDWLANAFGLKKVMSEQSIQIFKKG